MAEKIWVPIIVALISALTTIIATWVSGHKSGKSPTAMVIILAGLVGLLVGVVIGIPVALWLGRYCISANCHALGLLWHRWEGYPSVYPGRIRLVGPVDIQTHDNYQSGDLTVTAEARAWAPDTSIGFEIWAPDRCSIRVSRGRLITETPIDSYEEAIPGWSALRAGPITFKISWSGSRVKLYIDGQPILDHTGREVPTRSLKVRLRAAQGDVLTVTQVEVTKESISSIVDSFEYVNEAKLEAAWETDITSTNGKTRVAIDTRTFAPDVESRQSLKIITDIPCLLDEEQRQEIQNLPNEADRLRQFQNLPDEKRRFQQIQRYWISPQDWSDSNVLEIWVKGDGKGEPPWGGELSIVLIDGDDEVWQSTRWFDRWSDWTPITIHLVGSDVGNPWGREDFVIPEWETKDEDGNSKVVDQKLDTGEIRAIWIKSLTTDDWACGTEPGAEGIKYPEFTIWVDHIAKY